MKVQINPIDHFLKFPFPEVIDPSRWIEKFKFLIVNLSAVADFLSLPTAY
jgi:hypothetical protein